MCVLQKSKCKGLKMHIAKKFLYFFFPLPKLYSRLPRWVSGKESLGVKAMTNLDSILKSRDIILMTKILIVKAMVFTVVMYGYKSWTIEKTECQKIDALELWCWRRLLRVPWTAGGSNQSILKEIDGEYSLERLLLKLKLL